jgi:hypothetical protein
MMKTFLLDGVAHDVFQNMKRVLPVPQEARQFWQQTMTTG